MAQVAGGIGVYGYDATGGDAYAALDTPITAPAGHTQYWHIQAWCATFPAQMSFDGGVTDGPVIPAGGSIAVDDVQIPGPVYAKNSTAGSNYTALHVFVW